MSRSNSGRCVIDLLSRMSEDTWKVRSLRLSWTLIFQHGMCSQTLLSWLLVSYDRNPVLGPGIRPYSGSVQAQIQQSDAQNK